MSHIAWCVALLLSNGTDVYVDVYTCGMHMCNGAYNQTDSWIIDQLIS